MAERHGSGVRNLAAAMRIQTTVVDERSKTRATLRVLAYFDVFRHPLTVHELARFTGQDEHDTRDALTELLLAGIVRHHLGYWSMGDARAAAMARIADEERAQRRMPKALRMSALIARFPFVRAVFISGSMSKGRLDADGDIDFFIITAPGRLWVARTLLVLFKKVFLLNSRRDFCVNYFIDTEHLTIEDQNRFTATEVVTLIPTYGNGTTEAFFSRNAWAFKHYPHTLPPRSREVLLGHPRSKRLVERLLGGSMGAALDALCMQLTWRFWRFKFSDMDPRTFDLALRTRTYVSKHHPRNFQQRVLDAYHARLAALDEPLN